MEIRHATESDIPALAPFAARMFTDKFGHIYAPENLQQHLEKTCSPAYFVQALHDSRLLLALAENGEIIGYGKCGDLELPVQRPALPAAEIQRLYVDPQQRGQGIGHQLMQHLLADSQLATAKAIYLSVFSENFGAQRFYARYGFTKIDEYDYHVGTHIDLDFIFCRERV